MFIFQFFNFYSSVFYIAFFKGRFVGYPSSYSTTFGCDLFLGVFILQNKTPFCSFRNEDCIGGCMKELAIQLGIIMVAKQVLNNVMELVLPRLKLYFQRWQRGQPLFETPHDTRLQWESDYELVRNEGLFEEYLEMVIFIYV